MGVTDHKHYDRWYIKQNRESSTSGMLFKSLAISEVRCFARNIYKAETVTSGLCYIEGLIFLENNITMVSQRAVQWIYIIYFDIWGSFLATCCISF